MDVGQKIRYVREMRGLSLTDLRNRTGLSLSYLSDAENNKSSLSLKSLDKIAEALHTTPSYLIDRRNVTLDELAAINHVELPSEIKEYVVKQESLPYISLIKEIDEDGIFSLEFLQNLIELHKKEIRNTNK